MVKKEVWFVMKDTGGTNNVLPVALYMKKVYGELCDIRIIADTSGQAVSIIERSSVNGSDVITASPDYDIFKDYSYPGLIVSSMCSGKNLGRYIIGDSKGKCPRVAMPDSPWGRYQEEWSDPLYWPEYLIVNDRACKDNVLKIWSEYEAGGIKEIGWPYLDRYYQYNLQAASKAVVEFCGEDLPIITFIGQLEGTNEVLKEVITALSAIDAVIYFVPRFHPRASEMEENTCKWALGKFRSGQLILDSSALDTSTLIAGSDIVVSVYSLSLIEAAALRKQTISVITKAGYKMFRDDIGEKMIPDFGNAGYAYEVHNLVELTIALQKAINGKLRIELLPKQKAALTVDGKNAERVANFLAHDILNI